MACDAASLIAAALGNNLEGLSARDQLICLASIYGGQAGYANATVAVAAAYASGLAKLSDRDLEAAYLSVIC